MSFSQRRNSVVVSEYIEGLKRKKYSPKTRQTYGYALSQFVVFLAGRGRGRIQDVTVHDLDAWRVELLNRGLKPASVELFLRAVRNLFNWLEDTERIFANPAAGLLVPKAGRLLPRVHTEEEIKRLLARPNVATAAGIRDRAILEVGYCCGLRREELAGVSIFDPDLDAGTLRVLGKGRKERVLPLGKHAAHWLKQYMLHARPKMLGGNIDHDALWVGVNGKPLGGQGISVMMKRYGRECRQKGGMPLNLTPHSLRRACATHMLRRGAHPVQIQMLLGHAGMKHLAQYLRLTITDIKKMHAQSRVGK